MNDSNSDGLVAISAWVNGDLLRRATITSHCSGVRITLEESIDQITSMEGAPHGTALRAVAFASKPTRQRAVLDKRLRLAMSQELQARIELQQRESVVKLLKKQLEGLDEEVK